MLLHQIMGQYRPGNSPRNKESHQVRNQLPFSELIHCSTPSSSQNLPTMLHRRHRCLRHFVNPPNSRPDSGSSPDRRKPLPDETMQSKPLNHRSTSRNATLPSPAPPA